MTAGPRTGTEKRTHARHCDPHARATAKKGIAQAVHSKGIPTRAADLGWALRFDEDREAA